MYSGFGLGTLLLPVMVLFFPVELAVAATAVVHLANNVLKSFVVGRHADASLVLGFGVPALLAAFAGAWLLDAVAGVQAGLDYEVLGLRARVTPVKAMMAALIFVFGLFDLVPALRRLHFPRRWLGAVGAASGFFGGLSGHQGALRSAVLAKSDMDARAFVGTNALIGLMVDVSRTLVYGAAIFWARRGELLAGDRGWLLAAACLAAFAGVLAGRLWLTRVTMSGVRYLTGALLVAVALGLGLGFL
jgi:uncharacterized membrane protein YfcA